MKLINIIDKHEQCHKTNSNHDALLNKILKIYLTLVNRMKSQTVKHLRHSGLYLILTVI